MLWDVVGSGGWGLMRGPWLAFGVFLGGGFFLCPKGGGWCCITPSAGALLGTGSGGGRGGGQEGLCSARGGGNTRVWPPHTPIPPLSHGRPEMPSWLRQPCPSGVWGHPCPHGFAAGVAPMVAHHGGGLGGGVLSRGVSHPTGPPSRGDGGSRSPSRCGSRCPTRCTGGEEPLMDRVAPADGAPAENTGGEGNLLGPTGVPRPPPPMGAAKPRGKSEREQKFGVGNTPWG